MNIQLMDGEFMTDDALEIMTQMIDIKIKFHEKKIMKCEIEEDIKAREAKIKRLQKDFFELRSNMGAVNKGFKINAVIKIN